MTHVARPLRGLPPVLAALAAVVASAMPAAATDLPVSAQSVNRTAQWWLAALHVPAAVRAAHSSGKGVTVAVLSTGVDLRHRDLAGSVLAGPDLAATGRKHGSPYWGQEGTAVASLIAGHGHGHGGTAGITGVAPAARILSIQVTLEYDDPLTADATVARRLPAAIAAGIRYAVGHGASIIALPLDPGTLGSASSNTAAGGGSAAERAAVKYALAHNVLLIAPAGDNGAGRDAVNYPAAYPGVVAVGATARDGRLALFTNMRSYVALTAPGSGETPGTVGLTANPVAGLTVAAPGDGYQSLASTDMSAGLTAGVAALIRSRYPRLDVAAVTRALERGVTAPPGGAGHTAAGGPGWGHGQLDAVAAVAAAAAIFATLPAPTPTPSATPSAAPTQAAPVVTSRATPSPADPGRLLRTLVAGLAVGAGVLIACLIGAITVTRIRRHRRRIARSAGQAATARAGQGPGHARHARAQHAQPAEVRQHHGGWTAAGTDGWYNRRHRSEAPPWPPAPPPDGPVPLPAQPVRTALPPVRTALPLVRSALPPVRPALPSAGPLPPWEESPSEFAVAPPEDSTLPRTGSSTGPMYIWNPGESTGQFPAVSQDPWE